MNNTIRERAEQLAGILSNWGKTAAHPDWNKPAEQMIELVAAELKEVQREARIAGLEEAAATLATNRHRNTDTGGWFTKYFISLIRARIEQIKKEE